MELKIIKSIIFAACLAILSGYAFAVYAEDTIGEPGRSSGKKNPLKNVYFGEQHLDTSASPDAFVIGGTKHAPGRRQLNHSWIRVFAEIA